MSNYSNNSDKPFEISLMHQQGCMGMGEPPVVVTSVSEARKEIVRFVTEKADEIRSKEESGYRTRDRVVVGPDLPWESLSEIENSRHYDPSEPECDMTVYYLLEFHPGLEGVGGIMWPYVNQVEVTGPPEVWDHPPDQPCGMHDADMEWDENDLVSEEREGKEERRVERE